jgi:hypothetical protein
LPTYQATHENEKLRATSGIAYHCDEEERERRRVARALQVLNPGETLVPNAEFKGQSLKPLQNFEIVTVRLPDGTLAQRYVMQQQKAQ